MRNICASWGILLPLIQKIMERNGLSGNGTRAHFTKNTGPPSKYYNGTNSLHSEIWPLCSPRKAYKAGRARDNFSVVHSVLLNKLFSRQKLHYVISVLHSCENIAGSNSFLCEQMCVCYQFSSSIIEDVALCTALEVILFNESDSE